MRRSSLIPTLAAFFGFVLAVACGDDNSTGPVVQVTTVHTVKIMPEVDTLTALGMVVRLVAGAFDADGNQLFDKPFTWASSDPGVARVNSNGIVEALENGIATIRATTAGVSGFSEVVVDQEPISLWLTPNPIWLVAEGHSVELRAWPGDANGYLVSDASVTWTVADPSLVNLTEATWDRAIRRRWPTGIRRSPRRRKAWKGWLP